MIPFKQPSSNPAQPADEALQQFLSGGPGGEGAFQQFVTMMRTSSNQSQRFKKLLDELKSGDPVRIMQGVIELSQELSMAQENTLHHFQADAFIPQLVECLKQDAMPDTIYFAMISLTQIMDILPNCCNTVVNCGGVKILVERIQHIEYIDVAEQAIKGLEKISTENPHSIVIAGGLGTMLNLIEFFDNTIQRRVIRICAKISQNISNEQEFNDHVSAALPALTSLLRMEKNPGEFSKFMLENVSAVLVRISEVILRFFDQNTHFPKIMAMYDILGNAGVIDPILRILSENLKSLNSKTIYNLLKVLSLCCKASFQLSSHAINIGAIPLISQILAAEQEKEIQENLVISELLYLLDSLLPDFSVEAPKVLPPGFKARNLVAQELMTPPQKIKEVEEPAQKKEREKKKLDMMADNGFALLQFTLESTMPYLLALYEDSSSAELRLAAIMAIHKMLTFANPDLLATSPAINVHKLSHMLFGILESKNSAAILLGLEIVEILLEKQSSMFLGYLQREGVLETIKKLQENQDEVFTYFAVEKPQPKAVDQEKKEEVQEKEGMEEDWEDKSDSASEEEDKKNLEVEGVEIKKKESPLKRAASQSEDIFQELVNDDTPELREIKSEIQSIMKQDKPGKPFQDYMKLQQELIKEGKLPIQAQEELIHGIVAAKEEEIEGDPALSFMEKMENMGITMKKQPYNPYSYYTGKPQIGSFGSQFQPFVDASGNFTLLKRLNDIFKTAQLICFKFLDNDQWLLKNRMVRKQSQDSAMEGYANAKTVAMKLSVIARKAQNTPEVMVELRKELELLRSTIKNLNEITNYEFMSSGIVKSLVELLCSTPSLLEEQDIKGTEESKEVPQKEESKETGAAQIKKTEEIVKPICDEEAQLVLEREQLFFSIFQGSLGDLIKLVIDNTRLANELSHNKELGLGVMTGSGSGIPLEVDSFSPINSLRQLTRRIKLLMIYEPDKELIKDGAKLNQKMELFFQRHAGPRGIRKPKPGTYGSYASSYSFSRHENELEDLNQNLAKKQILLDKIIQEQTKAEKEGKQDASGKLKKLREDLEIRQKRTMEKIKQIQELMKQEMENKKVSPKKEVPPSPPKSEGNKEQEEEEKDPYNVSKTIIIPFSVEQCGSLQLISDFLINRIKSVDELEKMKVNTAGVIEFAPNMPPGSHFGQFNQTGAIPTYGMNPTDLIDELADRMMSLPSHFPQVERNDIVAEIEESGLTSYVMPQEGEEEQEDTNPENLSFDQMSSAGRILERIRIIEQQLTQNKLERRKSAETIPSNKESTPVKDLSQDNQSPEKPGDERKIRKIVFYMNGMRVSGRSIVHQLLKNPSQFVSHSFHNQQRYLGASLVLHFRCKSEPKQEGAPSQDQKVEELITPHKKEEDLLSSGVVLQNLLQKLEIGVMKASRYSPMLKLLKYFELALCDDQGSAAYQSLLNTMACTEKASKISYNAGLGISVTGMSHNSKIASAIQRQLQDPFSLLADSIPAPLETLCTSLKLMLPFSTRHFFFKLTALGVERSIFFLSQHLKQKFGSIPEEAKIMKAQRQKIKVQRDGVIESGIKLMKNFSKSNSFFEFEYAGEVGSGLGPTLEFYTLSANGLRSISEMWRNDVQDKSLFPAPLELADQMIGRLKVLQLFRLAGFLIAKCIVDDRIIDLPFSPLFWKKVKGEKIFLQDISVLDQDLGAFLLKLQKLVLQKKRILRGIQVHHNLPRAIQPQDLNTDLKKEYDALVTELYLENSNGSRGKVEDLCLNFTLPGYESVELETGGRTKFVTIWNLEEYLERIIAVSFYQSIEQQVEAFRDGFRKLIKLESLSTFGAKEIEVIYCGNAEQDKEWEKTNLVENIHPAHGYTSGSPTFKFLIEYLSTNLSREKRRIFLKFITGAPRLPLGGFKALSPKLQVVERKPPPGMNPNDYLPSVMTCQNFLKMPRYDSLDVLESKFNHAIDHTVEFDMA